MFLIRAKQKSKVDDRDEILRRPEGMRYGSCGSKMPVSEVPDEVCVCSPWMDCYCGGSRDAWDDLSAEDLERPLPTVSTTEVTPS